MPIAGVFVVCVAILLGVFSRGKFISLWLCGQWVVASEAAACDAASKTSAQRPQRTQPLEILSWSGTILKTVSQAGQRVLRLILTVIVGANLGARGHQIEQITAWLSSRSTRPRCQPQSVGNRVRRQFSTHLLVAPRCQPAPSDHLFQRVNTKVVLIL